jgi:type IV pilus assembly protein PilV
VALIEALVGILLFCIGILGLVGLQASMSRAQTDAKFRADASYLGNEIVGAMWSDRNNLANYATTPTSVCSEPRCASWVTKVRDTLPSAAATVAVTPSTGIVDITLTWAPPSEGTRTYVLSTAIR